MRKIIILLLCCGVLVSMVGCGGNTALPLTESPPTTVSETVITEAPTETAPPVTAIDPTEKEKEPIPTERKAQATEPTTTATEPTTTAKPNDENKPTETTKPTKSSAAENPKDNGCITIVETNEPPTEEIIIPPKPSADAVAQKVATYINQFRTEQGDVTATVIPRLTEYCKYRCTRLKQILLTTPPTNEQPPKPYSTANMLTGHYTVSRAKKTIIPPTCAKPSVKVIGAVPLTR